ncbi:MAG: UbiA family prenyltransferase [Bacteroidota bacterium]
MKFFSFIIHTNIFISLAAVALTVATQVQMGLAPQLHPYLFIIFFATIFEYNLHRLVTVIKNPQALDDEKHKWVKKHLLAFYILVAVSVAGFALAVCFAKKEVLITLFPIGLLTVLYSLPLLKIKKMVFRLREIPLAKIFVISVVWSGATILLPVIESGRVFETSHVVTLLIERFIFVFAITVPFDIRDMVTDRESNLKTIPILLGEQKALRIAGSALLLFTLICTWHYLGTGQVFLLPAFILSALSTYIFINNKKIQNTKYYHYFVLDGTMLLQALLVCLFYYLTKNQ